MSAASARSAASTAMTKRNEASLKLGCQRSGVGVDYVGKPDALLSRVLQSLICCHACITQHWRLIRRRHQAYYDSKVLDKIVMTGNPSTPPSTKSCRRYDLRICNAMPRCN